MVWLVLLIFVAPAAIFTAAYNRLLTAQVALKNAFAQIDVLLTRRHELLPNLIESMREQLPEERRTLDALLSDCDAAHESLRSAAGDPGGAVAVQQLAGGALLALGALLQRHPELKSSLAATALEEELSTTERRVAVARQTYNTACLTYNADRESFPGSLAAGYFGFTSAYLLPAGANDPSDTGACAPASSGRAGKTAV
jgi:LemA protein